MSTRGSSFLLLDFTSIRANFGLSEILGQCDRIVAVQVKVYVKRRKTLQEVCQFYAQIPRELTIAVFFHSDVYLEPFPHHSYALA